MFTQSFGRFETITNPCSYRTTLEYRLDTGLMLSSSAPAGTGDSDFPGPHRAAGRPGMASSGPGEAPPGLKNVTVCLAHNPRAYSSIRGFLEFLHSVPDSSSLLPECPRAAARRVHTNIPDPFTRVSESLGALTGWHCFALVGQHPPRGVTGTLRITILLPKMWFLLPTLARPPGEPGPTPR